ncbi:MAG: 2-dehydropantoate 2-reductase [Deltaproteobacteria bacterium]|nr:2-dehydropantoate 2-reductase [Deltaproteobacteria bacterium]
MTAVRAWAESARVVVVGCGGVGGCTAARLADAGRSVVAVTGNPEITRSIGEQGLHAGLPGGERVVRIDVVTRPAALPAVKFDIALLAVPPNRIDAAADEVLPHLADDGVLVPLANGLPEERLGERFGHERVVGGIVGFGASMHGPGRVEQTSEGTLIVGRLHGGIDQGARRVAALLEHADPGDGIELTANLRGARWSKLAVNAAISSLGTIGGDRLGALMRHRFARRLALEVMTEVTQTALGAGVKLEKISGAVDLEWLALDADERVAPGSPSLLAKHTLLLAVGARYRRLRSSMLAAIERGREPPIEFLNGEVVSRAAAVGVATPINQAVVDAVRAIAAGGRRPSLEGLRQLFDDTRPLLRSLRLAA